MLSISNLYFHFGCFWYSTQFQYKCTIWKNSQEDIVYYYSVQVMKLVTYRHNAVNQLEVKLDINRTDKFLHRYFLWLIGNKNRAYASCTKSRCFHTGRKARGHPLSFPNSRDSHQWNFLNECCRVQETAFSWSSHSLLTW